MHLTWTKIPLRLASVFRTSKAVRTDKQTLWAKIAHDNIVGWGEAAPVDTYKQTLESAESALDRISRALSACPIDLNSISDRLLAEYDDQLATVAAIDAALHDWIGKRLAKPVWQQLGISPAPLPLTSFSIGIDSPDIVIQKVREAASFPILKLKIGTHDDLNLLRLVRTAAPKKIIRVDANAAWTVDQAIDFLPRLAELNIEFVEQPLPAGELDGLRRLKEMQILPIVADESCVRPTDVAKVAGCVDGVNIKLSKCGGLRPGLQMIRTARELGLKVMLGCMIESSLGIAAPLQLASLADWLDLDGHLLLAHDPFTGIGGAGGRLFLSEKPGLGVEPAS